ncbi:complement C1q-like protein 4 [Cheilinus undulatus]|uniref:complement C1q-like protein 4 n=1 Tax=Cheilinus undulatus TaxID=241271 RepID=UPI001BD397F3|nr:complement C1q-like protein 4 [Cheilinus undulatus]
MKAAVLLCLLHAVFGWHGEGFDWPEHIMPAHTDPSEDKQCKVDLLSCGCCLMEKQMYRMEQFFNYTYEAMSYELHYAKKALAEKDSRCAFSVALNHTENCYGPFESPKTIVYKHAYINMGDSYSVESGNFTVPYSGVYGVSVTIYGAQASDNDLNACAVLQVNGTDVSWLLEMNGQDLEDSATAVLAIKLKAGDEVAVVLPEGCVICDYGSYYNTFTAFLMYTTDYDYYEYY